MGKLKPWFAVRDDKLGYSRVVKPPNADHCDIGVDIHYACTDGDCVLVWAHTKREAEERIAEVFRGLVN